MKYNDARDMDRIITVVIVSQITAEEKGSLFSAPSVGLGDIL